MYGIRFGDSSSIQTWSVCQADIDLFQAVTTTTFVLHGVHMMYALCTFHFWMLLKLKQYCTQEKNMNSLNVEYFLAMNIQNLDKNW